MNLQIFSPVHASHTMRCKLSNNRPEFPLLLFVGRLAEEKKIHRLRDVLDRHQNATLALIGSGPHQAQLEQLFSRHRVNFLGDMTG